MTIIIGVLAGWFVLSLAVGLAFGRAARLGTGQTSLVGGPADPARTMAYVPNPAPAQPRRHSGPAAA